MTRILQSVNSWRLEAEMNDVAKELHDKLLAEMPEGATHEEQDCPFCGGTTEEIHEEPEGGSVSETKTYTEEEVTAKITEAVATKTADLEAKLAEFENRVAESAHQEQLASVQASLDAAVLELEQVKADKAEIEKFWADAIAEHEASEAAAARREERLAAVRAAATFPEEYLEANADRFAAMNDEDFGARLEEWKTIAPATASSETTTTVPATTAMTAASESTNRVSAVKGLADLRKAGIDPRTIN